MERKHRQTYSERVGDGTAVLANANGGLKCFGLKLRCLSLSYILFFPRRAPFLAAGPAFFAYFSGTSSQTDNIPRAASASRFFSSMYRIVSLLPATIDASRTSLDTSSLPRFLCALFICRRMLDAEVNDLSHPSAPGYGHLNGLILACPKRCSRREWGCLNALPAGFGQEYGKIDREMQRVDWRVLERRKEGLTEGMEEKTTVAKKKTQEKEGTPGKRVLPHCGHVHGYGFLPS